MLRDTGNFDGVQAQGADYRSEEEVQFTNEQVEMLKERERRMIEVRDVFARRFGALDELKAGYVDTNNPLSNRTLEIRLGNEIIVISMDLSGDYTITSSTGHDYLKEFDLPVFKPMQYTGDPEKFEGQMETLSQREQRMKQIVQALAEPIGAFDQIEVGYVDGDPMNSRLIRMKVGREVVTVKLGLDGNYTISSREGTDYTNKYPFKLPVFDRPPEYIK